MCTNSLSMMFLTKATQYNYKDLFCYTASYIFFTFLTSKFLSFLSNFLHIENDLLTTEEVGWDFCNSAYVACLVYCQNGRPTVYN